MIRTIIDVPLVFSRVINIDWQIDWRGQAAAVGTSGAEQIVFNRFPRWRGSPTLLLPPPMIGSWRALVSQARGRVNAWRFRMTDPAVGVSVLGSGWYQDWEAYRLGLYTEPRPQVICVSDAAAGDTEIVVDERLADRPISPGAILSFADWPFLVEARSGSGAAVTLQVSMLRVGVEEGDQIDLIPRGIFLAASDAMAWPTYGLDRVARPQLDLTEWITR